jgi:hypothetical protein
MRLSRSLCMLYSVAFWVPCGGTLWADALKEVANGTRLKFASANLENLWDGNATNSGSAAPASPSWDAALVSPRSSSLLYRDFDPAFSNWYDPAILSKKVEHVLQAVRWMGVPDILAAQEIESAGNQSEVQSIPYGEDSTLGKEMAKLGYLYFYLGKQSEEKPVSVTPAIWSKIELVEEESVSIFLSDSPTSSRDIQVMRGKVGKSEFLIFNSHWKSKRGGGEEMRRQTAQALRARIDSEELKNPDLGIIAAGDFNSDYYEEALHTLGTSGDVGQMLNGDTPLLYNLWMQLPVEKRWEYSFNGLGCTLSQILLSKHFFRGGLRYVDHSFKVIGQEFSPKGVGLLGADGIPYGWQARHNMNHTEFVGEGFSDHLPLVFDLEVVPSRTAPSYVKSKEALVEPRALRFDKVPVCKEGEEKIHNLEDLSVATLKDHVGECVRIDVPSEKPALAFSTRGKYRSVYVNVQLQDEILQLGVVMSRRWDPRPNIDDSRVNRREVEEKFQDLSILKDHPHSNKCVQRKKLQGAGGELRFAMGRIGYYVDGEFSIVVPTIEPKDLILENLPAAKQKACRW